MFGPEFVFVVCGLWSGIGDEIIGGVPEGLSAYLTKHHDLYTWASNQKSLAKRQIDDLRSQ
jgi:hypothetical protein